MVLEEMARGIFACSSRGRPNSTARAKRRAHECLVIGAGARRYTANANLDARRERALATLGNAPVAFGQTWHLPCCDDRPTYRQLVAMASAAFGRPDTYAVLGKWTLRVTGLF